ncbi:outer membrane protein assembly factor BamB family protein [Streptomyces xiamenensis]|uniref:outer membrane protein assembly factor BamB family protein n=1 Tax=Streptomyces xiamenensis TaxID=408015 RepID=UPI0035DF744C
MLTDTARRLVAAAALLALTLAGCSSSTTSGETADKTVPEDQAPQATEPPPAPAPTGFAADPVRAVDVGPVSHPPVALHATVAWLLDEEGLTGIDMTTGEDIARLSPTAAPLYEAWGPRSGLTDEDAARLEVEGAQRQLHHPSVVELAGRSTVIGTIPVIGKSDSPELEIIAADAETGEVVWTLPLQLDGLDSDGDGRIAASVIHADGHHVALQVMEGNVMTRTVVVDAAARQVAWESTEFKAFGGAGSHLAGLRFDEGTTVLGVDLAEGDTVWEQQVSGNINLGPAESFLRFEDKDGHEGPGLIDIESGQGHYGVAGLTGDMNCRHGAGGTTLVCMAEGGDAMAVDLGNVDAPLWQLPQDNVPGNYRAVFQDSVYLDNDDELVVMDARSGETISTAPGPAPRLVNSHGGIVLSGQTIQIYPAAP